MVQQVDGPIGWDGSLGGARYRAPYGANNHVSELGATLVCNGWRLVEVQSGEGKMLRGALMDVAMMHMAVMDL